MQGGILAVAPFLISQCYNATPVHISIAFAVAPFLISQCYNYLSGESLFYKDSPLSFV